jgi:hypothetical protein
MFSHVMASLLACLGVLACAEVASAQSTSTTKTEVEDSFFNQCTNEVVDRSYTRHVTSRNPPGDDVILTVLWSDGKGIGRKTGDRYAMTFKVHQISQTSENPDSEQGVFSYRIKTTVVSRGDASNYHSAIVIRLRTSSDGTVTVEETEPSGIECT